MGGRIVHCGDAGDGQAAKICNNMILGVSMIAVSEAFVLAEKLGLSPQALFDVASTSSGQCWSLNSLLPGARTRSGEPGEQRLQAGIQRRVHAEGSEARARSGRTGGCGHRARHARGQDL